MREQGRASPLRLYNSVIEKYAINNDLAGMTRPQNSNFLTFIIGIIRVLGEMRLDGVKPNGFIYTQAIGALSKNLEVDQAMHYYNDMKADGLTPTVIAYGALIHACLRTNAQDRAEELYREMVINFCAHVCCMILCFVVGCRCDIWFACVRKILLLFYCIWGADTRCKRHKHNRSICIYKHACLFVMIMCISHYLACVPLHASYAALCRQ